MNNQFYSCDDDRRNDGGNNISNAETVSDGNDSAEAESGSEGNDIADTETGSEGHDATLPSGGENCYNFENISVDDEVKVCMLIYNFICMKFICIFVFIY